MDDLQYTVVSSLTDNSLISFKPCYKWMTFNTFEENGYKDLLQKSLF